MSLTRGGQSHSDAEAESAATVAGWSLVLAGIGLLVALVLLVARCKGVA